MSKQSAIKMANEELQLSFPGTEHRVVDVIPSMEHALEVKIKYATGRIVTWSGLIAHLLKRELTGI